MSRLRRASVVAAATALLGVSPAYPVSAEPTGPFTVTFPAGLVCTFQLKVDVGAGDRHPKTFTDAAGNAMRIIDAGRGTPLVFTNTQNQHSMSTKANGSVSQTAVYADGTSRTVLTGHYVLFMFPTDMPAGPSTTLYTGRVVFTNDRSGVTTVQEESGRKTDICAALS